MKVKIGRKSVCNFDNLAVTFEEPYKEVVKLSATEVNQL